MRLLGLHLLFVVFSYSCTNKEATHSPNDSEEVLRLDSINRANQKRLDYLYKQEAFWYVFPPFISQNDFDLILTNLRGKEESLITEKGNVQISINNKKYFASLNPIFVNDSLSSIELRFFTHKNDINYKDFYIKESYYHNIVKFYLTKYSKPKLFPFDRSISKGSDLINDDWSLIPVERGEITGKFPSYEFSTDKAIIRLSDAYSTVMEKYNIFDSKESTRVERTSVVKLFSIEYSSVEFIRRKENQLHRENNIEKLRRMKMEEKTNKIL